MVSSRTFRRTLQGHRLIAVTATLLLAALFVALQRAGSAEPEPLTVMTWNLEWFYDEHRGDNYSRLAKEKAAPDRESWDWRRDAVANSLVTARPTIAAVQEVESQRVLWYLAGAIERREELGYRSIGYPSRDYYTEQDVGMLIRPPADLLQTTQYWLSESLRQQDRYHDVTKHLVAVFEFPVGERRERVTVVNAHLRSGVAGETQRKRQARLLHYWVADLIRQKQNLIVLGDFNSEVRGDKRPAGSDLGILAGKETDSTDDDLVDLNLRLPETDRQTHLLPGREFDHIFCSPALMDDEPGVPDLVFQSIELRRDLVIRGDVDDPDRHWESYWEIPARERDLSDHIPLMATFEVR